MAESSGELLGGRFRLLGERAAFPFGTWWEAEDEQGARTIVLRMSAEVAEPAAKATQAMAQSASIDSPHVVPWADGGVDSKGQGWLAAPMFGPWSLHEHVTRGEGIPPSEAAPIMEQLARGMAAADAVGVHHHCIASELVRLVPLPEGGHGVKIYGYGLSELLPSYKPLRKQDAFLGVPDYMSPELCNGKAAEGASADIYAAGVLMYETVRGRPPFAPTFASASASTTLKRHIFEKPLPLSVRYANAPYIKSYEAICFKALQKAANRRQLSLAELDKELEQLVVEEMRGQVVNLGALGGRGPTTARRLRTQVLPQVPLDEPTVTVAPTAAPVQAAAPEPEPAPVQAAPEPEPTPEPAKATLAAAPAPGPIESMAGMPRRSESTLVFAGLGPAVRELAEAARKDNEDEDEDGSEEVEAESATTGSAPRPQSQANEGGKRGKKNKKKKSHGGMAAASNTGAQAFARAETGAASRPSDAKSESGTDELAAQAATAANAANDAARVRRRDDKTVQNPNTAATVTIGAVSAQAAADSLAAAKEKAAPAAKPKGDESEDWFASTGVGDAPKKKNKAWIFILSRRRSCWSWSSCW
ncbi:MAG: protein kinase [Myxococcota bacterium]